MDAKRVVFFVFAASIGQAFSFVAPASGNVPTTYPEAFNACLKKFHLETDAPLKNYLKNGQFASEEETKNLQCFFECLTESLKLSDSAGKIDGEAVKKVAAANPTDTDLAAFANEEVLKSCVPLPDKYPSTSACVSVFSFTQCALVKLGELQAAPKP